MGQIIVDFILDNPSAVPVALILMWFSLLVFLIACFSQLKRLVVLVSRLLHESKKLASERTVQDFLTKIAPGESHSRSHDRAHSSQESASRNPAHPGEPRRAYSDRTDHPGIGQVKRID